MSARQVTTLALICLAFVAGHAPAQRIAPSALLSIDQNRATVVDRIVNQWGDRLTSSNAGIDSTQLREILAGLRADHLLAASLAGSVEGLRDVVSGALVHTDAAVSPGLMHTKSLGDTADDLVYTPIVPCRILDTRNGTVPPYNAPMMGGSAFPVAANLGNFAPQGGSATNCALPAAFGAIAVTLTVLNPNFDAFLAASSSSNFATLTRAVIMDFSANKGSANTAIVPVDGTVKFYLGMPAQVTTHVIGDVVGYFKSPGGPALITQGGNALGTTLVLGTDDNQAVEIQVNNNRTMRYEFFGNSPNVIGGSANNSSGGPGNWGVTIAGGGQQGTNCLDPPTNGTRSCGNQATLILATVGGGYANLASGQETTIAGGRNNTSSDHGASVGGGAQNIAGGPYSSVGGGYNNAAMADSSMVGGGSQNVASGINATVAGGFLNTASAQNATASGGLLNRATGSWATVVGGAQNLASGQYSVAAGRQAKTQTAAVTPTIHDGAFVFADSNAIDFYTSATNEFAVRATGGVRFVLGIDPSGAPTWTCAASNGNSWACSSDRNLKENFTRVNGETVLQRLSKLPLYLWNAKGTDPNIRHLGPTAQDFMAAFSLGNSDKMIGMQDADGVALAAIQGLHQMMRQKDAKLREQQSKISAMERELATIKEKLGIR